MTTTDAETIRTRVRMARQQGRLHVPMSVDEVERLLDAVSGQNVVPLPPRKGLKMEVNE